MWWRSRRADGRIRPRRETRIGQFPEGERAGGASGDSPARVLLVEDDPELPEVLARVLAHDGLEIECVATGA